MDSNSPYNVAFYGKQKMENTKHNGRIETNITIKPMYSIDEILQCGIIHYCGRKYLMDMKDRDEIINYNKHFIFGTDDEIYPSYQYNQHRINYLQFIYHYRENNVKYIFENGNPYDLRRMNVQCYHEDHDYVVNNYDVKKYIPGHYAKNGVDPYNMKNPMWKIYENGKDYLLMYCEKNTLCKLCPQSYRKITEFEETINAGKKITFYKLENGYIMSSNNIYIHQIITDCYGNGKGTKQISVDHIDRDPLNNTMENLRIATREEEEQNSKGIMKGSIRARKKSAKPLPEGITKEMMRKYVCYYHEWLNPEQTRFREYFKIEKHPKLDKIWIGTKSGKISIHEKLKQANNVVDDLENDIYPVK